MVMMALIKGIVCLSDESLIVLFNSVANITKILCEDSLERLCIIWIISQLHLHNTQLHLHNTQLHL